MMIKVLGHDAEVTTERICRRSGDDHIKLKHEARADRKLHGFDTDNSFALCCKCGMVIPLA